MKKILITAISLLIIFGANASADSDNDALIRSMQQQLNMLQETVNMQAEQIRELERINLRLDPGPAAAAEASVSPNPAWLEGLKSKGDFRLRYEIQDFENEDAKDRNRARFRIRWGLEKTFDEEWKAGFRVTSGPDGGASSGNQTFDSEFSFKEIQFDRAYAKWNNTRYMNWLPNLKSSLIGGGKVANPYQTWGTEIVWDSDVTPEGIYEHLVFDAGDAFNAEWTFEGLFGQFVVEESSTGNDVELLAYGAGISRKGDGGDSSTIKFAYYDWQDYISLLKSGTILGLGGNNSEVDEFKVISLYASHQHQMWWPVFGGRSTLWFFNWMHNLEEGTQVAQPGNDNGLSAGVKIGKAKQKGEWDVKYQYFYIEPNAAPSAMVDQDIAYGGTNNTAHLISYAYMLQDYLKFYTSLYLGERIEDVGGDDLEMMKWQFNLAYSF